MCWNRAYHCRTNAGSNFKNKHTIIKRSWTISGLISGRETNRIYMYGARVRVRMRDVVRRSLDGDRVAFEGHVPADGESVMNRSRLRSSVGCCYWRLDTDACSPPRVRIVVSPIVRRNRRRRRRRQIRSWDVFTFKHCSFTFPERANRIDIRPRVLIITFVWTCSYRNK